MRCEQDKKIQNGVHVHGNEHVDHIPCSSPKYRNGGQKPYKSTPENINHLLL